MSWSFSAPATSLPGRMRCPARSSSSRPSTAVRVPSPTIRAQPHDGCRRDIAPDRPAAPAACLAALPADVPVTALGVGSNLLVRDGGVKGVVIRLMRGFTGVVVEGHEVLAGAGGLDLNVGLAA